MQPAQRFDNFTPPYQFMRALLDTEDDLIIDQDHTIVISPMKAPLTAPYISAMYSASIPACSTSAAIIPPL